jgi:hypothetical protein
VAPFISTIVYRPKQSNCKVDIVHYLNEATWIKEVNWCEYIINCIKTCKDGCISGGGMKKYFVGAVTILLVGNFIPRR